MLDLMDVAHQEIIRHSTGLTRCIQAVRSAPATDDSLGLPCFAQGSLFEHAVAGQLLAVYVSGVGIEPRGVFLGTYALGVYVEAGARDMVSGVGRAIGIGFGIIVLSARLVLALREPPQPARQVARGHDARA